MSETYWAHKKWNKIASDIKLVFHSSTITMMHGPINIRLQYVYTHLQHAYDHLTWTPKAINISACIARMRIIILLQQLQRPIVYFCMHLQHEYGDISWASMQTSILLLSPAFIRFRIVWCKNKWMDMSGTKNKQTPWIVNICFVLLKLHPIIIRLWSVYRAR